MKCFLLSVVCFLNLSLICSEEGLPAYCKENNQISGTGMCSQTEISLDWSDNQTPVRRNITCIDCQGACANSCNNSCNRENSCPCSPVLAVHLLSNVGGQLGTFVRMGLSRFGELVGFGSNNERETSQKGKGC